MIRALILSPRFLPSLLMALQALSAVRWAFARHAGQTLYWISAFFITLAVTFLMGAK